MAITSTPRRPVHFSSSGVETLDVLDAMAGGAVRFGHRDHVEAVRRAEELFELSGRQRRGLRQEREDATTVVVDDDDGEVEVARSRTE